MQCYGGGAVSSGELPDLHYSSKEVHASWQDIVIGGARQDRGMAGFADLLTPDEADQIHDYILFRALYEPSLIESLASWIGQHACVPVSWMVD